jgi:hypothetical protein
MPTTSLRAHVSALAAEFATSVVAAIRGASLEEILRETSGGPARRGPGRPRGSANKAKAVVTVAGASAPARKTRGRLRRRSPEQIAKALAAVVALVKSKKDGLRAEEIRAQLKMEAKQMPRVLKEGRPGSSSSRRVRRERRSTARHDSRTPTARCAINGGPKCRHASKARRASDDRKQHREPGVDSAWRRGDDRNMRSTPVIGNAATRGRFLVACGGGNA